MSSLDLNPRRIGLIALLVGALLLGACGSDDESTDAEQPGAGTQSSAADAQDQTGGSVTVYGTEYAFEMPETLPAGETDFTLVNKGEEPHMFILAELKPDAPSVEELIKLDEKEANKYIVEQQVIDPIKPGETSDPITMDLVSGATYGYVCFVPSPKKSEGHGAPHAQLGMYGSFTVE